MEQCSVQLSSVAQLCPTLCDPMNCSTPGLPVHHQLPEFTPTHVHWVSDAIQPSHPLSSPSPPVLNISQQCSLTEKSMPKHSLTVALTAHSWFECGPVRHRKPCSSRVEVTGSGESSELVVSSPQWRWSRIGGTSNTHESWTEAALTKRARVARHCSAGCRQQLTISAVLALAGWTEDTVPELQAAGGYYPQWPKLFPPARGYAATHVHIYPSIHQKEAGEGDRGNKSVHQFCFFLFSSFYSRTAVCKETKLSLEKIREPHLLCITV